MYTQRCSQLLHTHCTFITWIDFKEKQKEQHMRKTNLSKLAAKLQIFYAALHFIRIGWLLLIMLAVTHLMCQLENVYVECRCKWMQYIFVRFKIVVRGRQSAVPNECICYVCIFCWVIIKCVFRFGCVSLCVCSEHLFFALILIFFFISTLNCGPTAAVQFAIISHNVFTISTTWIYNEYKKRSFSIKIEQLMNNMAQDCEVWSVENIWKLI